MKRKILYILLSVLIAFVMWVVVITTVSPEWEETYEDISVVLNNEAALLDRGLMLDQEKAPTVTLKLKGNRSELINLNKSDIVLRVNLAGIYELGKQNVGYSISIPGNNSVEVISQSPQEISLNIVERKTKQIRVDLDYVGAVPSGYRTDTENLVLSQEFVSVTGPAYVVDRIAKAQIKVNLDGKKESIIASMPFTLMDESGNPLDEKSLGKLETDVQTVDLTLKIQRYQDVTLKLNVIPGPGASLTNVDVSMDIQTIRVAGPEHLLNQLGTKLELGELRLTEILEDSQLKYKINLPEGIDNLTGKKEVTVTVSFRDLATKSFEISNIEPENVPANMKADITAMALTVIIRGTQEQIDELTEEDIKILVDFTDATLGSDTYPCKVVITGATDNGPGAVGVYTVNADVEPKTDTPETTE